MVEKKKVFPSFDLIKYQLKNNGFSLVMKVGRGFAKIVSMAGYCSCTHLKRTFCVLEQNPAVCRLGTACDQEQILPVLLKIEHWFLSAIQECGFIPTPHPRKLYVIDHDFVIFFPCILRTTEALPLACGICRELIDRAFTALNFGTSFASVSLF